LCDRQLGDGNAVTLLEPFGEPATMADLARIDVLKAEHDQRPAPVSSCDVAQTGGDRCRVPLETFAVQRASGAGVESFPEYSVGRDLGYLPEGTVTPKPRIADRAADRHAVAGLPRLVTTGDQWSVGEQFQVIERVAVGRPHTWSVVNETALYLGGSAL
jgi:hypothetical protein